MFDRFARSWQLTKQSFAVLSKNPVLMVFPCLSALATLLVIASFVVPLFKAGALNSMAEHHGQVQPLYYVVMFAFYYCCYFVQIFFNCALMASANMVLCGGKTTLQDGIGLAFSRLGRIAAWALIASTVGLILRTLQERAGMVGKIIIALLGAAWSILTYFIVPVVMFEDEGLFDGIKRSGQLVAKTWGEGLANGVTLSALNLLAFALWVIGGIVAFMLHPLVGVLWAIGYLCLWMIVVATVEGIFRVALYRYAWIGAKTDLFDQNLIENAFVQKPSKKFGF